MRPACLFFYLALFATSVALGATPKDAANDSIVIDGRVIQVEAQVRFDSLPPPPSRAPFHPTWSACGLMGAGTDWAHWSGRRDRALGVEVQWFQRALHQDFRSKSAVWFQGAIGAMATSIVDVQQDTFPDSLIGFLPATGNQPLRFVISQRFDIGTETDTVLASTIRSAALSPYATLGLTLEKKGWSFRVLGGVQYFAAATTLRMQLQEPSLTGSAYLPGAPIQGRLRPRFECAAGYRVPRSPWKFEVHGTALPSAPQNLWVGMGVTYFTDTP